MNAKELEEFSKTLRKEILISINGAKSGHPGGSLSSIDILNTLYFGNILNIDPKNPRDENRDRFVLSKGHAAPALYTCLAYRGFFDKDLLYTLRKLGSPLQGHPDSKKLSGIETSTGSLGHGLSIAVGMALALKLKKSSSNVYCLIGDGEMQEGIVYESLMCASHYHLDNLCVILDFNGFQIDGAVSDVMDIRPVREKFEAFGFLTHEVDGHNYEQLLNVFENFKSTKKNKPFAAIAHTVKGKGVSFMENKYEYHGKPPTDEELNKALSELGA
ncbi:MAG TPA: transketolase [Desulfurella acetivorans]|uniref:Transketolase n=1 Tax=Desulfurella acetivorans TaxID=33002 RepID=A0A7C6A6Q3_DESAE|nr:transketolase [Desulfurella acetivorans]